jgi:hypothetical protein
MTIRISQSSNIIIIKMAQGAHGFTQGQIVVVTKSNVCGTKVARTAIYYTY